VIIIDDLIKYASNIPIFLVVLTIGVRVLPRPASSGALSNRLTTFGGAFASQQADGAPPVSIHLAHVRFAEFEPQRPRGVSEPVALGLQVNPA